MSKKFAEHSGLNLTAVNQEVLAEWEKNDVFHKSIDEREGCPQFIFFEGPPSANGHPGIHHVLARSIKDTFNRYKTMQGFQVHRKAGWDTHGLPVELGVEKELGITKKDIDNKASDKYISTEDYNKKCRENVMMFTAEWRKLTEEMGYFVDLDHPYITYDNKYIETLWWLLKEIYGKGLLYKGKSIQPYSPAAGTGLSSHELNQPGCYRDVKDTTCTAQFKVIGEEDLYFLAWTTTPWTLPSNTALCVGPNIDYVKVKSSNPYTGAPATYIVARDLVDTLFNGKTVFEVLPGVMKGSELVGMRYEQLIPWFRPDEGAFRVIAGDYVSTEEGTGIVHIAPTFGADDAKVAKAAGVPGLLVKDINGDPQAQVDPQGRFYRIEDLDPEYVKDRVSPDYAQWAGRYVKNAYDDSLPADAATLDVDLCVMMKTTGKVFRIEKHVHSYPHCWRTDKPVLYYPLNSWFIRTTAVREKMMELNDSIEWKPESTGSGRFGKWLENIQDWNLSRSRYWGTPLPIWRTADGREEICIGSVRELYDEIDKAVEAGFMESNPLRDKGFNPDDMSKENYDRIDLHRPYVDNIFLVSPSGRKMTRETDLIDVWFDSGSMPYAQTGLRGRDSADFGSTADFIAEGVDQTRGWFYTLHAIHTMVSGTPAFRRVISNGLVLDKNGQKMSKRLGNAVDPFGAIEEFGSDAVRWYMITNSAPWDNLKFDTEGVKEVTRSFFGKLFQTYSFLSMYANVDGWHYEEPDVEAADRPEMDRWMLSSLNSLVREVEACYEDYEPTRAGRLIQNFVVDNVSNWFVRLSRKRFWGSAMSTDKLSAYQTLYTCLETVAKLMAPIAPYYADRLYRDLQEGIGRASQSVHLSTFPTADESLIDREQELRMQLAQQLTSMVLSLRKKEHIIVRQPLQKIAIPAIDAAQRGRIEAMQQLILDEVNVKELEFVDAGGVLVKKVKCNFRVMGKKFGKLMKSVADAVAALSQDDITRLEQGSVDVTLADGTVATIENADVEIFSEDIPGWTVANEGSLTVALDIQITDQLRNEGVAREIVKRIQTLRKESGLEITDRIRVSLLHHPATDEALQGFRDYVAAQVLADEVLAVDTLPEGGYEGKVELETAEVPFCIEKK